MSWSVEKAYRVARYFALIGAPSAVLCPKTGLQVALFTPRQPLPTLQERCLQVLASTRDCSRASLRAHGLPEAMVKRVVDGA